jgi:GT2 family glycosyltransferase
MTKVTLQLVTWNAEKYLPTFFLSLKNQLFTNWELLIWDNASSDKTVKIVQKNIKEFSQNIQLVTSVENKGFAYGHNQLFDKSNTELVALLSSDIYMESDCLEKLVDVLFVHVDFAVAAPRLMRWNFAVLEKNNLNSSNIKRSLTNKIDSIGLKVLRNRRVVELGQGEEWIEKETSGFSEVFGVSGALALYRRFAIKKQVEFFDPLFQSYQEDVDLAFRLRQAGDRALVVLNSVAHHDRQAVGTRSLSDISAVLNKKKQNKMIRSLSYRNHLMVLIKNEYWQNVVLDLPWIFWYELKKFAYFLLFDRLVLVSLLYVYRNAFLLKNKRKEIIYSRQKKWKEIRIWWNKK